MGKQRFSITPAKAARDQELSDTEFRTLALLGVYGDENGWCWPSISTIAKHRGISRQAVSKHIKSLKKKGYLNVEPRYTQSGGRTSNQYQLRFDYPPATSEVAPPATSEVALTTQSNDPPNEKDLPSPHQQMFDALAEATGIDYSIKSNAGMIARSAKGMRNANYGADVVRGLYGPGGYWYHNDWRGKKGQKPTLMQIAQTIGQYSKHLSTPQDELSEIERIRQRSAAQRKAALANTKESA